MSSDDFARKINDFNKRKNIDEVIDFLAGIIEKDPDNMDACLSIQYLIASFFIMTLIYIIVRSQKLSQIGLWTLDLT